LARTELFHLDSVGCAIGALASGMNAPLVLRREALDYPWAGGATCFGSRTTVHPEKAIVANCSAVRELDANGTNFGFNPRTGSARGEFGHNDFYPVVVAAVQQKGWDGAHALRAMVCVDEIRGRLAEVFGLKDHKIDHVVHGAIASAAVYGALSGANAEQIESAIGMVVAHYIPFRAIRHGHQLSDSKGASAALSAEVAVLSVLRAQRGFVGPQDILRNPQALFCLFERPPHPHESPFDLELAASGEDFAVMGMHFKMGLYEHQSAAAIQGLLDLLQAYPALLERPEELRRIRITIYEPAFSIIGDPHKRDPRTRQSADHSMLYIIATTLRKAFAQQRNGWRDLVLLPEDYNDAALGNVETRKWMDRIVFEHGGPEYDSRYPDGIPTTVEMEHRDLGTLSSGMVMYPLGHARNRSEQCAEVLGHKFDQLAGMGVSDVPSVRRQLTGLLEKSSADMRDLYAFPIRGLDP
ncbi:MAG TPA: MmgE/PrpD family protein, partial [Pirellulaceae bacterium]